MEKGRTETSVTDRDEALLRRILNGIDKTEVDSDDGWWETSTGAEFGAKKLAEVIAVLRKPPASDEADARRYRRLCSAGLPLCFQGDEFYTKEQFDAAIDADIGGSND